MKPLRERISEFFQKDPPPVITEQCSLHDIAEHYPSLNAFIERKYGIKPDMSDNTLSLKEFCEKYGLPPSHVLLMEVQFEALKVRDISATDARMLLERHPDIAILDVRETWEIRIGRLPNSRLLDPQLLDEILGIWPKEKKILLYCHHGTRSQDAATFLTDRGFKEVYNLNGGIDAWSTNIDLSIPKYQENCCRVSPDKGL